MDVKNYSIQKEEKETKVQWNLHRYNGSVPLDGGENQQFLWKGDSKGPSPGRFHIPVLSM